MRVYSEDCEVYPTRRCKNIRGVERLEEMTDQPEAHTGTVELDGMAYLISPTAFRSHYQVMTNDGKLVGLIEMTDAGEERKVLARVASGSGITQSFMLKIADAAMAAGIIK